MIALSYSVLAVRQSVVIVYIVGGMRAWHSNAFVHQIKFAAANFAENVAAADGRTDGRRRRRDFAEKVKSAAARARLLSLRNFAFPCGAATKVTVHPR